MSSLEAGTVADAGKARGVDMSEVFGARPAWRFLDAGGCAALQRICAG
jgi:hypothetical protein